jgi:hypothetical protein
MIVCDRGATESGREGRELETLKASERWAGTSVGGGRGWAWLSDSAVRRMRLSCTAPARWR